MAAGRIALAALAVLCFAQSAPACIDQITEPETAALATRLSETSGAAGGELAKRLEARVNAGQAGFCSAYTLGGYYTRSKDYPAARSWLEMAIKLASPDDLRTTAPWNVLGFVHLQEGNLDAALATFQRQLEDTSFPALPPATQMKVYNNTGYTALQLGRYDESVTNLEAALGLGSSVAQRNLDVVNSILATLKSGDIDAPGIFAAVLISLRDPGQVQAAVEDVGQLFPGQSGEIAVFATTNEFFAITLGSYESYPKAEQHRELAMSKGYAQTYITSVAEWTDVTGKFVDTKSRF